jgi:hypothetical protein
MYYYPIISIYLYFCMYFVVYSTIFGVDISTLKSADYPIIFFFGRVRVCWVGCVPIPPTVRQRPRLSRADPRAAVGVSLLISAHNHRYTWQTNKL